MIVQRRVLKGLGLLLAIATMISPVVPAFAATTAPITGTFTINAAPSVDAVTMADTSLTPQSNHVITVDVSDADSIDDISQLVLKLWYDTDGGTVSETEFNNATANAQTAAVLTWTKSGQSAVAPVLTPAGTTWSLVSYTVPSTPAHFSGTSFQWSFTIKVGKVATETNGLDRWQAAAKATDLAGASDFNYDATNATMNWYGEISGLTSVTVDWGTVAPGLPFNGPGSQQSIGATAVYIANGAYDQKVKSDATWLGNTYTATLDPTGATASNNEFALKADDTATYASAVLVDTVGVTINDTGVQTTEIGDSVANNTLWLKLASSFDKDTYSGTITYIIANGS